MDTLASLTKLFVDPNTTALSPLRTRACILANSLPWKGSPRIEAPIGCRSRHEVTWARKSRFRYP